MIIAIDFDGTCVTHEFPNIGKDIGAEPVLKWLIERGHKFILHTMRSGKHLKYAREWFKEHGIELYGVNENPSQYTWTDSPKPYAQVYIDDAALGCPLIINKDLSDRPYVDWRQVETFFRRIFQGETLIVGHTDLVLGGTDGDDDSVDCDDSSGGRDTA